MGVEQTRGGKFAVRLHLPGNKRRSLGAFDTRAEAEQVLEAAKQDQRGERMRDLDWDPNLSQSEKRKEFEIAMGVTSDYIHDTILGDADIDDAAAVGKYISHLAENEDRYVNRRRARALSIGMAREALMIRKACEAFKQVVKGIIKPVGYAASGKRHKARRTVCVALSDLHFGAQLTEDEYPKRYTAHEEVRRLAKVIAEVRDYKPHYRDQTNLEVLVLGDLIRGLLHVPHDGDPLTDQFAAVVYALAQAIGLLAGAYSQVCIRWRTGNHGRNKLTHPGRQTTTKWDSFETMIGIAVRLACERLPNVAWDMGKKPFAVVPLYGQHLFATHGDTVFHVGNPGKTLALSQIDHQMARINATGVHGYEFAAFVVGHAHIGLNIELPTGTLIINPPLTPEDGYATSLGLVSACGQYLWESVEGHPVGDTRLIRVGEAEDKDASLEKLIKPARFSYDP